VAASVPGVYAVSNASRDVQLVVVAAAEGVKDRSAIDQTLLTANGLGCFLLGGIARGVTGSNNES
jgi:hypothetical protein